MKSTKTSSYPEVDLRVMRRMATVPGVPSGPGMSHPAWDDYSSRPTPSRLSERFPLRPYYRFYYVAVAFDVADARRMRCTLVVLL